MSPLYDNQTKEATEKTKKKYKRQNIFYFRLFIDA